MRVLVTGATGFVGQHLLRLFSADRIELFGTFLQPPDGAGLAERIKLVACDLRQADEVRGLVRDIRPQQIYHLAALSSVRDSFEDAKAVYNTNFLGSLNVLEAVRVTEPAARVLLVGSGHCYGRVRPGRLPIVESEPLCPDSPYGVSKAAADMLGGQFFLKDHLQVIRARPFNHTGPGQSSHFVCSDFARQFAAIDLGLSPPVIRVGNTRMRRDFSDVRDVVRAYVLLMRRGIPGESYNVGSGRAVALGEILAILRTFCSRDVRVEVEQKRCRGEEPSVLFGSNRKLRRATEWNPEYRLRETLRHIYRYWEKTLRSQRTGQPNALIGSKTSATSAARDRE